LPQVSKSHEIKIHDYDCNLRWEAAWDK